jgi:threonine aldolase
MLHRLGGSTVHKAGIAAEAALVALDTMVDRIADDHRRARDLAMRLAAIDGLRLDPAEVETNIVLVDVSGTGLASYDLLALMEAEGVRGMERDTARLRFVTHRLISDEDVATTAAVVADLVERHAVPPTELPDVEGFEELDAAGGDDPGP